MLAKHLSLLAESVMGQIPPVHLERNISKSLLTPSIPSTNGIFPYNFIHLVIKWSKKITGLFLEPIKALYLHVYAEVGES